MKSNIQLFSFNTHSIRTTTKDGNMWFIAKDLCSAIKYPACIITEMLAQILNSTAWRVGA